MEYSNDSGTESSVSENHQQRCDKVNWNVDVGGIIYARMISDTPSLGETKDGYT